jgi:hypothetical protein
MNSVDWIHSFNLLTRENHKNPDGSIAKASKAEIKRWLDQNAIQINGEKLKQEQMDFPMFSVVLFPKGKKITLL